MRLCRSYADRHGQRIDLYGQCSCSWQFLSPSMFSHFAYTVGRHARYAQDAHLVVVSISAADIESDVVQSVTLCSAFPRYEHVVYRPPL